MQESGISQDIVLAMLDSARPVMKNTNITTSIWPDKKKMFTYTSESVVFDKKFFDKELNRKRWPILSAFGCTRYHQKTLKVSVVNLTWLLGEGQKFPMFSKIIKGQSDEFLKSGLIQALLNQLWNRAKYGYMIYWFIQYVQYCIV